MRMNSKKDTKNSHIPDELKGLIIRYMEARNNNQYALAEAIMKQIEQTRST